LETCQLHKQLLRKIADKKFSALILRRPRARVFKNLSGD
jgi:hypothetical protein